MDEFSISPNPLRIPSQQPVTLVIKNVGKIPHEFMAGRQVQGNDFEHDFFAGLHVNIWVGTNGEAVPNGQMDAEGGSGHHGGDHEHGTMVVPEPGQNVHMSVTLPKSRRGEWSTGCFFAQALCGRDAWQADCGVAETACGALRCTPCHRGAFTTS